MLLRAFPVCISYFLIHLISKGISVSGYPGAPSIAHLPRKSQRPSLRPMSYRDRCGVVAHLRLCLHVQVSSQTCSYDRRGPILRRKVSQYFRRFWSSMGMWLQARRAQLPAQLDIPVAPIHFPTANTPILSTWRKLSPTSFFRGPQLHWLITPDLIP